MPMYEYRCECGKTMDVLVRNGREPGSCLDAESESGWCNRGGALTRMLSAPAIAKGGKSMYDLSTGQRVDASAECGHCGSTPGSCMDD